MGDRPGHPFRGNQWTKSQRIAIPGKFGNVGKTAVKFGPGDYDTTSFRPSLEEAHKEADEIIVKREAARKAKAERVALVDSALAGYSSREAESALAREIGGGSKPSERQIAGFIRQRYGTTVKESRKHARRLTNRAGYIDAGGTSRAKIPEVINYLRTQESNIQRKG